MTHLAELHIPDGLHQFADEINMRAALMQSNLDNAAWALSSVKATMVEKFIDSKEETAQDEEEDEALQSLLRKMDSLVSQIRSAKVIATKGIHQLKELKSRSLTLEPSTSPVVEQSQNSTQELVSSCCLTGLSLWNLLNDETRKDALTGEELLRALTSSETSPFTTLLSKTNVAASQMQSFYNLTTTLSQTVEFSTSGVRPWEIISQKVRAVSSTLASYEKEVGRLKDELAEKHTALAIKDKILEELSVNVEVLEKRVGESGGRREKLRELEGNLDSSRSREREMAKKLVALEHDLRSLEAERESWKRQILRARAQAGSRDALEADDDLAQYDSFSPRAQEDIVQLKAEIASLQSTIRYLRLSNHETYIKSAHSFLETPLVPSPKPLKHADLGRETRDVLKSMMTLVTQPESQLVKLERLEKQARLGWRPARQTSRWQIGRQREDWEAWREWRDDVRTKTREWSGEANGKAGRVEKKPREILARVGFRFYDLDGKAPIIGQEVMIANPHEWEALETSLGLL
jgi:dynactin 1